MPKKLSLDDFRARRWVLVSDDFTFPGENPDPPPTDLIDTDTWHTIIQLPDDVLITTTNHFGTEIRDAESIRAEWVSITLDIFGPSDHGLAPFNQTVVNSFSELQASIFNVMIGYYRTAISILRNTLEHLTIGLDYELRQDRTKFDDWIRGSEDTSVKFGISASGAARTSNSRVADFEAHLMSAIGDNVFRQADDPVGDRGGFSRRLASPSFLSMHTATPGKTEADLSESNGPIFVSSVFKEWCNLFGETMAMAALYASVVPAAKPPAWCTDEVALRSSQPVSLPSADGAVLLQAIAADTIWT